MVNPRGNLLMKLKPVSWTLSVRGREERAHFAEGERKKIRLALREEEGGAKKKKQPNKQKHICLKNLKYKPSLLQVCTLNLLIP